MERSVGDGDEPGDLDGAGDEEDPVDEDGDEVVHQEDGQLDLEDDGRLGNLGGDVQFSGVGKRVWRLVSRD